MRRLHRALVLGLLLGCGGHPATPPPRPPPEATVSSHEVGRDARLARAEALRAAARDDEAEAVLLELARDEGAGLSDRAEAWWLIGEINFDAARLDRADAAYGYLLAGLEAGSEWYPVVAYKWAWTAYRADRYQDALDRFALVLRAPRATNQLREEAQQYLAVVAAEPDWDGDGAPDASRGLSRPEVARWWSHVSSEGWANQFLATVAEFCDELLDPQCAADARAMLAARTGTGGP